jgi:hypothetical protein
MVACIVSLVVGRHGALHDMAPISKIPRSLAFADPSGSTAAAAALKHKAQTRLKAITAWRFWDFMMSSKKNSCISKLLRNLARQTGRHRGSGQNLQNS